MTSPRTSPSDDIIKADIQRGLNRNQMAKLYGISPDLVDRRVYSVIHDGRPALVETAEKVIVERLSATYDSGVAPRRVLIALPRLTFLHGVYEVAA